MRRCLLEMVEDEHATARLGQEEEADKVGRDESEDGRDESESENENEKKRRCGIRREAQRPMVVLLVLTAAERVLRAHGQRCLPRAAKEGKVKHVYFWAPPIGCDQNGERVVFEPHYGCVITADDPLAKSFEEELYRDHAGR